MRQEAKTMLKVEFTQEVKGPDGYTITFVCDDSFRGMWLPIAKWNLRFGYYRVFFFQNVPDLFRKVLRPRRRK